MNQKGQIIKTPNSPNKSNSPIRPNSPVFAWKKKLDIDYLNKIAHNCNEECKESIEIIDKKNMIYGCKKSGVTHKCKNQDCNKFYYNVNDDEFRCIFSDVVISNEFTKIEKWKMSVDLLFPQGFDKIAVCGSECVEENLFLDVTEIKKMYGCIRCKTIHKCNANEDCRKYFVLIRDSITEDYLFICGVSKIRINCQYLIEEDLEKICMKWREDYKEKITVNLSNHTCNYNSCVVNGNIMTISRFYNLFGCGNSGYFHICENSKGAKCDKTFLSENGIWICIFSKAIQEMFLSRNPFQNLNEQINSNSISQSINEDDEGIIGDFLHDEGEEYMEIEEEEVQEEKNILEENIKDITFENDLDSNDSIVSNENANEVKIVYFSTRKRGHENHLEELKDFDRNKKKLKTSEKNLENRINGVLSKNEEREKKIEELFNSECKKTINIECKRNRSKNRMSKIIKQRDKLEKEAESILKLLLWKEDNKVFYKKNQEIALEQEARKKIKKYYNKCFKDKKLPVVPFIDNLWDHIIREKTLIKYSEFSLQRSNYYINLCFELWKYINNTPYCKNDSSQFHWNQHVIGTLYFLKGEYNLFQNGKSINIFKPDSFVEEFILPESDLNKINPNFKKASITHGINNIKNSINSLDKNIDDLAKDLKKIFVPFKFNEIKLEK
jgi:hypothetical protein